VLLLSKESKEKMYTLFGGSESLQYGGKGLFGMFSKKAPAALQKARQKAQRAKALLPPDIRQMGSQMGSQMKQAAIQNAVQTATGVIDQRLPPQFGQVGQQLSLQLGQAQTVLQQKEMALQQCLGMLQQYQATQATQVTQANQ